MPLHDADLSRWFADEVQPHEADLRVFLRRSYPSLSDIDDLVQETYARVFRAKTAGKVAEARPYLFSTARNAACDLFRRSQTISIIGLAEIEGLPVVEDRPGVAEALDHAHELALLHQAIGVLPGRCRRVLTLCKVYGLPHREVAQRLGISEHTVNAQVALGVLRCRNFLRARGLMREREP